MNKSWHLSRRQLLRGAGISLALPLFQSMEAKADAFQTKPCRFACIYFPYGVSLPPDDSEIDAWKNNNLSKAWPIQENDSNAHWRWFPRGEGKDFQFNRSLEMLEGHRNNLTVIGGLSHPRGRKMGGHDTGDTFLTAGFLSKSSPLSNTVSVDQVMARHIGLETRFRSLVLSTDGGVGRPRRATTLSFDKDGAPVPAQNQPRQIFERLFAGDDASSLRRLRSTASMLDALLEDSRSLSLRLGTADKAKLDEYLSSVRQTEKDVTRAQRWLEIPRPELNDEDRESLQLHSDDNAPEMYIRTMYDLIYLAFLTDSTRIATYQISSMNGADSKATKFSQLIGFQNNIHNLAHSWNKKGGAKALGEWDRFLATQFTRFLDRLSSTDEGGQSLLDSSLILYGSSNSQTHNNTNYPLILAGGKAMNVRHGNYLRYGEEVPMSNLFTTLLGRMNIPTESFADSTGDLSDLIL
jgi:hypothetical protein